MPAKNITDINDNKISLKEFFNNKIDALEKNIETVFELNKLAFEKYEAQMATRLVSMNEWRDQSKDQMSTYATKDGLKAVEKEIQTLGTNLRTEWTSTLLPLQEKIDEIRDWKNAMGGKASQKDLTTTAITAIVGVIAGIVGIITALVALLG